MITNSACLSVIIDGVFVRDYQLCVWSLILCVFVHDY